MEDGFEKYPKKERSTGLTDEERHGMAVETILNNGKYDFDVWVVLSNKERKLIQGVKADTPELAITRVIKYKLGLRDEDVVLEECRAKTIINGKARTFAHNETIP